MDQCDKICGYIRVRTTNSVLVISHRCTFYQLSQSILKVFQENLYVCQIYACVENITILKYCRKRCCMCECACCPRRRRRTLLYIRQALSDPAPDSPRRAVRVDPRLQYALAAGTPLHFRSSAISTVASIYISLACQFRPARVSIPFLPPGFENIVGE